MGRCWSIEVALGRRRDRNFLIVRVVTLSEVAAVLGSISIPVSDSCPSTISRWAGDGSVGDAISTSET